MQAARLIAVSAALLITPAIALAASGGSPPPSNPTPPPPTSRPADQQGAVQSDAERLYGNAYQEVAKGQKDLEKGNEKKARKRFQKALNWCENAVGYKPDYYEAWNLIGFTSRKLDKYDQSLEAYAKCLEIKPTYAPAREYLGEALVELGRFDEAREQLAWLEKLDAKAGAEKLAAMIAAAEEERTKTASSEGDSKPESED